MSDKTHYRKAFDSPYLSSADIVHPIVVTIQRVTLEKDKTKKTPDLFNTAYWVEKNIRPGEVLKPMILNATNSKFLAQLTGSKWIDDWAGTAVEIYVDNHVRFGKETVEGLRLQKAAIRPPSELVEASREAANNGTAALRSWWEAQTEQARQLLLHDFRALKVAAKAADEQTNATTKEPTA